MTPLVASRQRLPAADGTGIDWAVLTGAGVEALFELGWAGLQARLGLPGGWFAGPAGGGELPDDRTPHRISVARTAAGLRAVLYVHPDLRWFAGHFPGRPLLPGVVQIGWAGALAAEHGLAGTFAGLSRVKFPGPVVPGDVVALTLTAAPGQVGFVLQTAAGPRTRGTLRYRD